MNVLAAMNPLDHVLPHKIFSIGGFTFTNQMFMMLVGAALLLWWLPKAVLKRRGTDELGSLVPTGWSNFIETICEYLRTEVAEPALGEHTDRFIKYIWSVFFFLLTLNLLGLLPISALSAFIKVGGHPLHLGGTATGNIWVTATFALCTMAMMIYNGLKLGGKDYIAHFCPGPLVMAPLLVPVEIIGLCAKIFALAIRLFANMIAGHILLAVLVIFILMAGESMGKAGGFAIAVPAVLGSIAITMLEIFVALLQAFIFTFLTTLFIGMSVNVHHDDHGEHEAAHAH